MSNRLIRLAVSSVTAAALALPAVAQESCTHNGEEYSDGARIGDLRCEDGEWVVVE